uniref:Reverse transcriptase domain-containing protein n=1 Tax=Heterorhabditis bacteriophora TaxID=37862 RepID=A0A1I7XN19_HETBA
MNVTPEHLYHREVGRDMFKEFEDLARKIDELSMGSKARWRRNQPHMNYTQFSRNSTESIVEFLDEFVRDMTIHEYEAEESVSVNKVNHCNREHRQRDREYYHRNDAMSSSHRRNNENNATKPAWCSTYSIFFGYTV